MPGHGRTAISIRAAPCAAGALLATALSLSMTGLAHAGDAAAPRAAVTSGLFDPGQTVMMVLLVGAIGFAVISAIALMRRNERVLGENAELRRRVADLTTRADRAEALVANEDQRLVAWNAPGEPPLVAGGLPRETGAPSDRAGFLAFGTWLLPESAGRLDRAVARLRDRGEAFKLVIATHSNRLIDVTGRAVGAVAVLRFRDLTGDRLARAEVETRHALLVAEVDAMRAMLSAAPMPAWLRDDKGRLIWVNDAYAVAVEAKDGEDAVARNLELIDSAGRGLIDKGHETDAVHVKRLPVIVAGARRMFEVVDVVSTYGSAGIATDVTAIGAAEAALRREIDFNARTLDQLATAVAIFGPDRRLKSYNAAYRALFDLDPSFLEFASRRRARCSTGCAPAASCPSRPTSAPGAPTCSPPIARSRRASTGGTCPTARPCASSPIPIRKGA